MKPLYMLAAEERLKGQPPRHAKVYKDDISIFEADMMRVRDYLLSSTNHSFGKMEAATGIPKATLRKMLSPEGIRREYSLEQLEKIKAKNIKRYFKVITSYSKILKNREGKWKAFEYRESDRERFKAWLMKDKYMLINVNEGEMRYLITKYPEDVSEEMLAMYDRFS